MSNAVTQPEDSAEFVTQLTSHQTVMLAYIRSLAPGGAGARDLLQEVNLTLWQRRGSFELGTNFKAWAFQTIRYHLLNHRRRLVASGWLVFDDDLLERVAPELEAETGELGEGQVGLGQGVERLRPQDRDLLHHRYASGSSLSAYAAATRRSAGTLKALLFNLRTVLRRCIERQLEGPGVP